MQLEAMRHRAIAALVALESQNVDAEAELKVLPLRDALLTVRDLLAMSGDSIRPKPAVLQVFAAELTQLIIDLEFIASRFKGTFEKSSAAHHKVRVSGVGLPMAPH